MTNIIILSLSILGGNTNQMTYVAPAGAYVVEYNFVEPARAVRGEGVWKTSDIRVTNTIYSVNVVNFTAPSVPALSLRLKKI